MDGVIAYMDTIVHGNIAAGASPDTAADAPPQTKKAGHVPATAGLTVRDREVVQLVVAGCSNERIAERLNIRTQTVKNQLSRIYAKVGVSTRVQLAVYALRHGLAEPE
jgi:two-component system nitrate/nitrite response regulator NarL